MNKRNVFSLTLIFLLLTCISTSAQWTSLQGPPGANVNDLERSSTGTLVIVTNGKIYSSTNNGDNWAEIVPVAPASLYLDDILIVGTTMYGLNYSQFWKSTDGGANWTQQNQNGAFFGVQKMIRFGPENWFAIYGWNGIYISKDEGVTWTRIYSKEVYYTLAASPAGDLYTTRWVEKTAPTNDENQIIRYTYPGSTGTYDEANWSAVYTYSGVDYSFLYYLNVFVSSAGKVFAAVYDNLYASPTGNSGTFVLSESGITDSQYYETFFTEAPTGDIILFNRNSNTIWRTANAGTTWTSVVNPTASYGSNVTKIVFGAGSQVFASSSGDGVFRSDNAGSTWALKSNGLYFGQGRQIEVANTTNRYLYLNNFNSKGYWTSTDNGTTWSFVSLPNYIRSIQKLADGKIILYGDAIYRSTDNGATFTETNAQYIYSLMQDGAGNLIASTYNNIIRSTDQGLTWATFAPAITGLPTNYSVNFMAVDNTNGVMFFYLYDGNSSSYKLYKVPTAGGAATLLTEDPWYDDTYANVNNMFITNDKLYVVEYNAFYESSDLGVTWKSIGFSGDMVFPIAGGLCVSKAGSLYITQDGGQSWNSTSLPIANSYVTDISPITGGFVASANNSPALKFTGNLILPVDQLPPYIDFNWQPMAGPYGGNLATIGTDNSNNVYAAGDGRIFKAASTMTSWTEVTPPNEYGYDYAFDKATSTIYLSAYNKLVKSTNGGVSWTDVNTEAISCRQLMARASNNDFVIVSTCAPQKVYASTNGGTTFGTEKFTLPENVEAWSIKAAPVSNAFYIVAYDYANGIRKFYKSVDRGTTWAEMTMPTSEIYDLLTDQAGHIYALGSLSQILKSTDNGTTWTNIAGDITSLGNGFFDSRMAYTTPSNDLWIVGYQNGTNVYGMYKTSNGGINWTFLPMPAGVFPRSFTTVGTTRIAIATDEGAYTSDDNGATFVERSSGMTGLYIPEVEVVSPTKLLALSNNSTAFSSTDSQNFTKQTSFIPSRFLTNPDGSVYAYQSSGVYKSYDNGNTWTRFSSYPGSLRYLATANGSLYFGADYNVIRYTLDFATWSTLSVSGLPSSYNINSMAVNGLGAVFIVIYNYDNGKEEMYQILFGSAIKFDKPVYPKSVFFDYEEEVIRLYDGQGVIYQTSDGSSWTSKSAPAGERMIVAAKGYYFIPNYGGVLWLSRNQGGTWQSVGLSSFNNNYTFLDVAINEYNGLAYAAISNSVVRKSANIVLPAETTLPTVASLSPLNNSNGVSVKPQLKITFDEAVTAVAAKTIKVIDAANTLNVIETINVTTGIQNDKTFTFNMSALLQYNKTYFVVMDQGAFKDIFNNEIAGWPTSTTTWRFTTKAAPTLTSVTPSNGASGVNVKPTLIATFSEPMGTVNAKNLRIYKSSDPTTPVSTIVLPATSNEFASVLPAGANADQPVRIRFDATKGSGNLIGATAVYTYGGVIVTNTTTPTSGQVVYLKGSSSNNTVGAMTKVPGENDVWEISLPSIRQYFNVPVNETIYYVALIFRGPSGNLQAIPPASFNNAVVNAGSNVSYLNISTAPAASCSTTPVVSGNSIEFPVCTPLEYNTQYFAKFDASSFITKDGGALSALTANTDWVFTTQTAPSVTSTTPADNTTGVSLTTTISVTFSTAVAGVNAKNLTIHKTSDDAVVATIPVSSATISGTTFTFALPDPTPLQYGTEYYVKTDANSFVESASFSVFQNKTDWNFTTVPPPDDTAPTINFTAANFTKGVANKLTITVTDAGSGVDPATVKVKYRGITVTTTELEAALTATATPNTYEVSVPDSWLDELGLEFSFEAKDMNANTATSPATGTHKAYIIYPENNALTIPASVLSVGGGLANYRIISIPHQLASSSITNVFNEFDMDDRASIRLLTWDNAAGAYDNAPDDFNTFARGVGYWINIKNSTTITLEGATTPTSSKETPFSMTLKPGWNQIGNPYPFPLSWSTVKTAANNTNIGDLKTFNGNTYATDATLNAFEGGFVFLNGTTQATVSVPVTARSTGREGDKEQDFGNGWLLPLELSNSQFSNPLGGIGMHENADVSFDQFDDVPLPMIFEIPEMRFAHPEHSTKNFTRDIVPLQNTFVWEFTVNPGNATTTLKWDRSRILGKANEIYLFDEDLQQVVNMLTTSEYVINSRKVTTFKVYYGVGEGDILPSRISLGKPFPNPAVSVSKINFSLPDQNLRSYQVSLDVFDLMGRKVKTIVNGSFEPGFYETEWTPGESEVSSAAIYLYKLTVINGRDNVVLTQKVIFNK